jgi:hypothetical protein
MPDPSIEPVLLVSATAAVAGAVNPIGIAPVGFSL